MIHLKNNLYVKVLTLLFCSASYPGCRAQTSSLPIRPHRLSLQEIFGVTGGANWDSEIKKDSFPGRIFANARMFYLQEKDFEDKKPKDFQPATFREGAPWGGFSENYYRTSNWRQQIPYIIHSWETVGKWPDKWYDCKDWGELESTVYQYTQNYLATFCPRDPKRECLVNLLEVGNEPWGEKTPGPDCFERMLATVIQAGDDYYQGKWRLGLSAPAFQNSKPNSRINDHIDQMLDRKFLDDLTAISGHFYAFAEGTHDINQHPESDQGRFKEFKDLVAWRDSVAPQLHVNITETGWNSETIGPKAQAAYLIRALLIAARSGVNKLIFYELYDQPQVPIYSSCGLIDGNKHPKESFYLIRDFLAQYGKFHFQDVISEEDVYVYQLSDGAKRLYLAWDANAYREKSRKVMIRGKPIEVNGMPQAVSF